MVRDGTVGPAGPLAGPDFLIPDSDGQTRGGNLFHSFSFFTLTEGERATFTGPDSIRNVIARVTGGEASLINGALNCEIPGANFFFINPFGILFGERAQINVQGSFAATTADYVKLADGGRFDARNPANDILTTAPVSAFGFLGPAAAPIRLEPLTSESDDLPIVAFLPDGESFWLVGGDIFQDGSIVVSFGGQVSYASVASEGELAVDLDDPRFVPDTAPFAALGDITLQAVSLYVAGEDGGLVTMDGNWLRMTSYSSISAGTDGDGQGGGVILNARAGLELTASVLDALSFGNGDAGNITLTAPVIRLQDQTSIGAGTLGSGRAGDVLIRADEFSLRGGGGLSTLTGFGGGAGGNLIVRAHQVDIEGDPNSGAVSSLSSTTAGGPAGTILIEAETIRIGPSARLLSDSQGAGSVGGAIYLKADRLILDDQNGSGLTRISSRSTENGAGGGTILLEVGQLELRNGAQITTSTEGAAAAGSIQIQAAQVWLGNAGLIASESTADGAAGSVALNLTGSLRMESSRISVASAQAGGGSIFITAGREIRLQQSEITAQALGDGGNVTLQAPRLIYASDSIISAESREGNGGNLTLDPVFVVLNQAALLARAIVGNGGNILIISDYFFSDGSLIDASSQFGLQGSVSITAPTADLAGELADLEDEPLDAQALLQPHCAVRLPAGISSFRLGTRPLRLSPPTGLLPAELIP